MNISGFGRTPMNFMRAQAADERHYEIVGVDPNGNPMYVVRDKDGKIIEYPKPPAGHK